MQHASDGNLTNVAVADGTALWSEGRRGEKLPRTKPQINFDFWSRDLVTFVKSLT